MITIIDYKTGNLNSIKNILKKLGYDSQISSDPDVIAKAPKLILPGVGHFDFGMQNLAGLHLIEVLTRKVIVEQTPILGICLGVQLFTRGSDEGKEPGLGWIDGYTRAFDRNRLTGRQKIPHMGWSEVSYNSESRLFKGLTGIPRYYFVHSYHLVCNRPIDELTHCNYGYSFVAGVERDNIVGVQFHPEKSHKFGMQIIENFVKHY